MRILVVNPNTTASMTEKIGQAARRGGAGHRGRRGRPPATVRSLVRALEEEGAEAAAKVHAEIERAIAEDHAEAIILGCAGMADLAASLSQRTGIPAIDGVGAAVKLVEALIGLGLRLEGRRLCSTAAQTLHGRPRPSRGRN